jgi:hypothetical protein
LVAVSADAQNIDAGKSPAQIFTDTCSACHRNARELKRTSAGYLRSHYTTSQDEAAAMANYLAGVGSDPRAAQQKRPPGAVPGLPGITPAEAPKQPPRQPPPAEQAKSPPGQPLSKGAQAAARRQAANAEATPAATPEEKLPESLPASAPASTAVIPTQARVPVLEPFEE